MINRLRHSYLRRAASGISGGRAASNLPTFAAGATLAMLLAMTIGTAITVRGVMQSQSEQQFDDFTRRAAAEINSEVTRSLTELAAVEGYLRVTPEVSGPAFAEFASTVGKNGTSVQALGYVPRVSGVGAAPSAADAEQGYQERASGPVGDQYPLAYLVPPQPDFLPLGRDLGTDQVYGPLLSEARRNQQMVVSAPALMSGSTGDQAVFMAFSPVFRSAQQPSPGSSRELSGYALAVYRAGDFLAGPAARTGLGAMAYRVLYNGGPDAQKLEMFPDTGGDSGETWGGRPRQSERLNIAGREWTLEVAEPPLYGLGAVEREVWKIVLAAGLALTLFATASTYSMMKSRQEAHTDLQLMTSQLRVILDSALEGILLADRGGRVVWSNQAFANMFSHGDAGALSGVEWSRLWNDTPVELHDAEATRMRLAQASAAEDLAIAGEDIRLRKPDDRTLSMTSAPVTGDRGERLGRLWVFRDVTQERRAVESQSVFISMVSHELRTPLTSMTGFIDLALDGAGGDVSEGVARLLRVARSNGERLTHLVSDILEVTRLETGHLSLEHSLVDMKSVIEDLAESMGAEFQMRRQALRLEIPGGLPPVWADRQRVAQVASNLMTNAFRYTPEGGAITISARKGEREIEVTVTDTGPGISPEYHALIFEKFARVEVRGPRPQGSTGLGLAISKALVERQGGWIKVWSEPGKGSAFTFALPVAASAPYVSGRPSTELHSVSANAA